jgi:hypothetical protein
MKIYIHLWERWSQNVGKGGAKTLGKVISEAESQIFEKSFAQLFEKLMKKVI